jgi:alanine racemase
VVKADAYGLGADRIVPALAAAGCRRFFVAHLDEALALLPHVPAGDVAVLNGLTAGTEKEFAQTGIVPVLNQIDEIDRWRMTAAACDRPLPAFIHIDTGMNRLGLSAVELDLLAAEPARLDGLRLLAWMSHPASADEPGHPMTGMQIARFRSSLSRLPAAPASLANSAGLFLGPDWRFDLVRPGSALYGINPTPAAPNPMRPALRMAARVLQVRRVDSPMTVGYGAAHSVMRPGRVATVAVGYADGYDRSLGAAGHVFVAGFLAPVIGRVSMDLLTVDVTDVPDTYLRPDTFVEIIGPHRPVDQIAREAGTIGYEILSRLGRRFHRMYRGVGEQRWAS